MEQESKPGLEAPVSFERQSRIRTAVFALEAQRATTTPLPRIYHFSPLYMDAPISAILEYG